MTDQHHHCPHCPCRLEAAKVVELTGHERATLFGSLKPGDVIPSGRCPACGGLVYPSTRFTERWACWEHHEGDDSAPSARWEVSAQSHGWGLTLTFRHPDGRAVELAHEIAHGMPQITAYPRHAGRPCASDAVAHIKLGFDTLMIAPSCGDHWATIDREAVRITPDSRGHWNSVKVWRAPTPDDDED